MQSMQRKKVAVETACGQQDRIPNQTDAATLAATSFKFAFLDETIPDLPIDFSAKVLVQAFFGLL